MNRGDLTNEQWEKLQPLLPAQKPKTGRPAQDHRRILNGILWVLRTGAPWRDLPEELGNWNSVHRQYRRWTTSGLWDLMLEALADGGGNDALQMIDSTSIRAHHRAAGARGGLKTRLLAARAVASRPKSMPGPTLRVFLLR